MVRARHPDGVDVLDGRPAGEDVVRVRPAETLGVEPPDECGAGLDDDEDVVLPLAG